jgi:mannosyltransferase
MTEYRVRLPLDSLLKVLTNGQMNMCLYYLLQHGWTSLTGASEFMLRLPSALFAAAAVPLVYALGTELRDRRTGLVAALLVTVNATCILYAQTARSYSMFVALCILHRFSLSAA